MLLGTWVPLCGAVLGRPLRKGFFMTVVPTHSACPSPCASCTCSPFCSAPLAHFAQPHPAALHPPKPPTLDYPPSRRASVLASPFPPVKVLAFRFQNAKPVSTFESMVRMLIGQTFAAVVLVHSNKSIRTLLELSALVAVNNRPSCWYWTCTYGQPIGPWSIFGFAGYGQR